MGNTLGADMGNDRALFELSDRRVPAGEPFVGADHDRFVPVAED